MIKKSAGPNFWSFPTHGLFASLALLLGAGACVEPDPEIGTEGQYYQCNPKTTACSDLTLVKFSSGGNCDWLSTGSGTGFYRLWYKNASAIGVSTFATSRLTYTQSQQQSNFDAQLGPNQLAYVSVSPVNGIVNGTPVPVSVTLALDYLDQEPEYDDSNNTLSLWCQ